jgi:hypothetical protein
MRGMSRLMKYFTTSLEIGAAADTKRSHLSKPRAFLILFRTKKLAKV